MISQFVERRPILSAGLLALFLGLVFQGTRALWEPDEGTFGTVAGEMLQSGNWLLPTLHHEPYPEKPPLMYWGMLAGMKIFGRNEWGLRVFYGVCFALTAMLTALIGEAFWDKRTGLIAGVVYATSILPITAANIARPDTPLALFTTAALYCFWKSIDANSGRRNLWKLLMCAAFGLGFLSKGPAALVPSSAMFLYLVITGQAVRYFFTPIAIVGLLIFGIIGLSWYVYFARNVPGSAQYFWDNQVWGRMVSAKYRRNPGFLSGLLVYVPALTVGALPWSLLWIKAFSKRQNQVRGIGEWWAALVANPPILLLALWISIQLTVLLLASSKLPLYVLPLFPALALLTAHFWQAHGIVFGRKIQAGLAAWVLLLVFAKYFAATMENPKDSALLWEGIRRQLPAQCKRVVLADEPLNGMGFYAGDVDVFEVTTSGQTYPVFIPPRPIRTVLESRASPSLAIVLSPGCRTSTVKAIDQMLRELNYEFSVVALPFHRSMIVCVQRVSSY